MQADREWKLELLQDAVTHGVLTALYECGNEGQWSLIMTAEWGPFDTASDVSGWFIRHWAPRVHLPMR